MPWTCCKPDEELPDNLACPDCGKGKDSHTLRFQKTKVFKIGAKKKPVIRLLWVRGADTRPDGDVNVVVKNADGAELLAEKLALKNGEIVVKMRTAKEASEEPATATVIVLDENLEETSEGLLLTLSSAEEQVDADAAVFTGRLRALGFRRALPLEPEADVGADPDVALDVDQSLARFQRAHAPDAPALPYVKDADEPLGSLAATYSDYAPRTGELEAPEFEEDHATVVTVLRLHLHRGAGPAAVCCRVHIEDAEGELLLTSRVFDPKDGKLEIEMPADDAPKAARAKVYYLDANMKRTGEGLLLTIGDKLAIDAAAPASQALRALGYTSAQPLTAPPSDADATLDLDLAMARFLRSQGSTAKPHTDSGALGALEAAYWGYRFQATQLTDL